MDIDFIAIGRRIRHFRQKNRITQEELAFRIESTPAYISNIECGKKKPSLQKLAQISEALGVTINDFIYATPSSVAQSLSELTDLVSSGADYDRQKIFAQNISDIIHTFITQ